MASIRFSLFFSLFAFFLFAQNTFGQCPDPVAAYAILNNQTVICEGETIEVDNLVDVNNPVSCVDYMVWDWGDGVMDTVTHYLNMTHVYSYPPFNGNCSISGISKLIDIRLSVVYKNGELHYQISPVTVQPKPQATFNAPPIVLVGDTVKFNNQSCYADSFLWDISPIGFSSTEDSLSYVFSDLGTYSVRLEAYSPLSWGCGTSATTETITVESSLGQKIPEEDTPLLRFFPNPCSEWLSLDFGKTLQNPCTLRVHSITGLHCHSESLAAGQQGTKIDLRTWPKGRYVLSLINGRQALSYAFDIIP